jgi:hypothetical protein
MALLPWVEIARHYSCYDFRFRHRVVQAGAVSCAGTHTKSPGERPSSVRRLLQSSKDRAKPGAVVLAGESLFPRAVRANVLSMDRGYELKIYAGADKLVLLTPIKSCQPDIRTVPPTVRGAGPWMARPS